MKLRRFLINNLFFRYWGDLAAAAKITLSGLCPEVLRLERLPLINVKAFINRRRHQAEEQKADLQRKCILHHLTNSPHCPSQTTQLSHISHKLFSSDLDLISA